MNIEDYSMKIYFSNYGKNVSLIGINFFCIKPLGSKDIKIKRNTHKLANQFIWPMLLFSVNDIIVSLILTLRNCYIFSKNEITL